MKRNVWFTALIVLSLLLVSLPSLAVEPGARQVEETPPVARPLGDQRPRLPGERFALELSPADGTSAETAAPQEVQADVNLVLDDGSLENGIGIGGTWEFIFLNRFTPDPGDFAFDLTEMQVYFEDTINSGVHVGDDIILVAYENTSGSTDPAVGSNWLASFPTTVQAVNAWNVYTLSPAVHFDGPGDVLLGVIALEKPGVAYYPAAIDQTSSQGRSWAGWWSTSPPPNPPLLPPNDAWTLIDNQGLAGNWMVRGFGTYSTQTPRVELLPAAQKGRGQPTDTIQYNLTLYNYTGQAGYFTLGYTGNAWSVSGPSVIGPLANGGSQTFQVSVTIPGDAACPDCDTVTVTAQAQSDPAFTDASTIETCVGEEWQAESNTDAEGSHWLAYACTDAVGAAGTCFYFGGLVTSGPSQVITGYSQKYDVASGTWTQIANLPTPVFGATAGYINGMVYVAGGFPSTTAPWVPTGTLQIYDVASNSWSAGPALPTPRGGASSGVIGGKFYVAGGQDTQYAYCSLHEYNPATNSWTSKAPIPDLRCPSFGGGTASGDRLFVAGDYFGENWFSAYDPASNTWDIKGNLPGGAGKKSPVLAAAPDCGGVFLYGGDLGDWSGIQDTTWYWHPLVDVWTDYGALLNQATTGGGGGLVNGRLWTFAGSQGAGPIVPPPHESLGYCCPAPPPAGSIEGTVTDADSGLPLENANIFLTRVGDLAFEVSTWTDASGYYHFGPLLVDNYELRAAAFGYYNENTVVSVTDGVTATVNFALDLSVPDLSPTSVATTLQAGHTGTVAVTLANNGTGDLHYHVSELPADAIYPPVPPAVADLPSGLDPQLSADTAAAVDGTASFIVYLVEQADLSQAFTIKDRSARGHYVLDALRATAVRTQAGLKAELDRAGAKYESRYIVNALVVRGNLDLAQRLAARPEVAYVSADHAIPAPEPVEVQPQAVTSPEAVEWNIAKVRADAAWNSFGARGKGVVVANIDTGVLWDHPALVNQYRGGLAGDHEYNWWDPYGYGPTAPYDFHSHGSHTMGTMVGGEGVNQIGMAPAAKWFACQGFDRNTGSGYEKELLECAEFILAPWDLTGANPNPDRRPDVVNNSWGGGQAQWWYSQAIYAWQAAGIFPTFSAGNDGPACDTAGDPGDMVNIMAVGATNTSDSNAPGTAAAFSSRGPAKITGALKPNVSAPGADIRSAYNNGGYGLMSGTSMASPHVAGEAALIWSAQPELWGNVQLTYWLIQQSATPLLVNQGYYCGTDTVSSVPNNQYGWGRIDAFDAVDMALSANWDIPWLAVEPANGVVVPAGSTDVVLTFDATGLTPGQCYSANLLFNFNEPYVTEAYLPVDLCVNPVHIAKTAAPLRQAAGQDVTYTIVFGNNSTPLAGVVVSDTLPTQVDFVSATLGGTYDVGNHEVVWSGLNLGTGSQFEATVVVTIKGDIPNCTDINNEVYLFYGGPAPLSATAYHSSTCYFLYLPLIGKEG